MAAKSQPNPIVENAIDYAAHCAAEETPEFQAIKETKANAIRSAAMQTPQEKVPVRESSWQMNMSAPTRSNKKGK